MREDCCFVASLRVLGFWLRKKTLAKKSLVDAGVEVELT